MGLMLHCLRGENEQVLVLKFCSQSSAHLCLPPSSHFLPSHGQGSPGITTELSQDYFCHGKYHLHNVSLNT